MFRLIISVVLALAAAGCFAACIVWGKDINFPKTGTLVTGFIFGFFALIFLLWSTLRIVPPRSVGIQVTLGKVESTLDSGPHMVKPWSKVVNFPSTMQVTKLHGEGTGKGEDGAWVTVRLANQTTALVSITANWQVNTNDGPAVESLYQTWRSFDALKGRLLIPQMQYSVQKPFESYNPLTVLQANGELVAPIQILADQTKATLQDKVGTGITIQSLNITFIGYDNTTQEKINGYAQAVADTRIAEQRKSTAEAQRQANDALASSQSSKDPGVLTQNCLDLTERMVKEGKGMPAAWSCIGEGATPVVNVR